MPAFISKRAKAAAPIFSKPPGPPRRLRHRPGCTVIISPSSVERASASASGRVDGCLSLPQAGRGSFRPPTHLVHGGAGALVDGLAGDDETFLFVEAHG